MIRVKEFSQTDTTRDEEGVTVTYPIDQLNAWLEEQYSLGGFQLNQIIPLHRTASGFGYVVIYNEAEVS